MNASRSVAADMGRLHIVSKELEPRRLESGGAGKQYTAFEVNALSPLIGAEIRGVDLSRPMDVDTLDELKRAFLDWKVLFFRGQNLTGRQQAAFARNWGELQESHPQRRAEINEVARLEHDEANPGSENIWHSDASFHEAPPLGAVLRAVDLPPLGGDTLWADTAAAYDGLPQDIKKRIEELRAVHELPAANGGIAVLLKSINARSGRRPVEHPVVRTHPETGRRSLYVNAAFTSYIVGLSEGESEELLGRLLHQLYYPEYQVRFHWEAGSVAFWDNRTTVHYGVNDYYPHHRLMERVVIAGDRPR
ncbi:TauD/TfdA dioxygenase family protein [Actinacidiphila sp. bgisy145]|uniref:TauD/TfdA dioxygenase family protein n=1 Tax=Actinacidiphila sp. bgisy145 TaxID=3413792 RepID=UPI003EC0769B